MSGVQPGEIAAKCQDQVQLVVAIEIRNRGVNDTQHRLQKISSGERGYGELRLNRCYERPITAPRIDEQLSASLTNRQQVRLMVCVEIRYGQRAHDAPACYRIRCTRLKGP